MDSQTSLLLYRYLFMIGFVFEPCWGLFLKNAYPEFHENIPMRIFAGVICGIGSALTFNQKIYEKYFLYIILLVVAVFNGERLFLLTLNPDNWYYIIDAYTITILSIIVAPSKIFLVSYSVFILGASLFFPGHSYALFTNNFFVIPLIASLKYALFAVIKKLNNTLDELKSTQAKLKNQSVLEGAKTLISNLSHDINNNLAKVSLNSVIVQGLTEDKSIQDRMTAVQQEVVKTTKIIASFKDLINIGPIVVEKVDINELIADVIYMKQDIINESKININKPIKSKIIECDVKIIKQCLIQVFKNAIDAVNELPMNSLKEITVKFEVHNDEYRIVIENNGPLILVENESLIFDAFFTTKSVGYGFGLGLTIARELIENHCGSIEFSSNGGLTIFAISFKK